MTTKHTESRRIIASETKRIIAERDRLLKLNRELVTALHAYGQAVILIDMTIGAHGQDVWPELAQATIKARAALAKCKE